MYYRNGIALCKVHHWAFDRGVLTIKPKTLEIKVSSTFVVQGQSSIDTIEQFDRRYISGIRKTAHI
ncbi:HNH endonuclease [Metabacillus indicus]|uniref:HNH endonuclease n=1 Tax=Metabacillus indicus TaxID=246786 RepID=UPI003CE6C78A